MERTGPDEKPHGKREILPGIQLLRGWAAALVVIAHGNSMMGFPQYFGRDPYSLDILGSFGVAVFFVISGFIIAIVALDRTGQPRMSPGEYAKRRFMRIVPFMWVCTIGYNLLVFLGTGSVEWLPALRALVLWPVGELKPNVLWSLRHEFLFYLLFGLTMMVPRKRPQWLILWFAAPLIVYAAVLPFDPATTPWHPYNIELVQVVILGAGTGANVQLGVGFLLGMLWLRQHRLLRAELRHGLWVSSAATLLGAMIVWSLALEPGLLRTLLWTAIAGPIVYTGIIARSTGGWLHRVGLLLGNASFSTYLVHNAVLLIVLEASRRLTGLPLPPTAWLVTLVVLATVGGVSVHLLVERPLIKALAHGRAVVPWMLPRRSVRQ